MPEGPFGGPRPFSGTGMQLRWVSVLERGTLDEAKERDKRDEVLRIISREIPEGWMDDIAIDFREEPKLEVVMIADVDVDGLKPNTETRWGALEMVVDALGRAVREIHETEDTLIEPAFDSPEVRLV